MELNPFINKGYVVNPDGSFSKGTVAKIETVQPVRVLADVTLAKSTPEEKLNKTERAYLSYLRTLYTNDRIGIQNVRLVLGHDCTLTPDFTVAPDENGCVVFIDTKALRKGDNRPHVEDDSWVKLRTAARLFRWARFKIAWMDGDWVHEDVKP